MSKFELKSFENVGKINFLEERNSVRSKLGSFKEFKKSKFSKNTTDDFGICHVFYDTEDKVSAVEIFSEAELLFKDKNLFSFSYGELKNFVKDEKIEEDDSGAILHTYGISVYAPDHKKIESILAFKKGYYA